LLLRYRASEATPNASASRCRKWQNGCRMAEENGNQPVPRPLTRRERQIATLASKGVPNGKIAKRLGLSIRTVESHLYRVYGKLGVSTRDKLPPLLGVLLVFGAAS
jgi:DNA-binding CsgD family transcriptional regulator